MSKKPAKEKTATPKVKKTRLFQNYRKVIEQFVLGKSFTPMSLEELAEKLNVIEAHREFLTAILEEMVQARILKLTQGRYYVIQEMEEVISGVIRMHPRGFGFMQADDPVAHPQDIFIPRHLTKNAVDGDKVEVLINPNSYSEKGPEGKVVAITSRGRTHIAGIVSQISGKTAFVYAPMLGKDQRVLIEHLEDNELVHGDRIVMEVIEWGGERKDTLCRLSHKLGHISDPSCDIAAAIEEYEIRSDFPKAVIQEATGFGSTVQTSEIKNREDLRALECFTIDPDTAKDFDDAISLTKDEKGFYHLGVHIADVSHYVRPNTNLDREAFERCNSTYFPGKAIPMLPHELSDNLCSLKPKVNRLTISVFMIFDHTGELQNYRIAKTVIKSAHRFTYKEAKLVLDNKKKSPHAEKLQLMVEICGLLKKKRYERGSVEFAMPELVVLVDEKGMPYATDYIEYDITHQLVEEFMLKANETVAKHLDTLGKGLPFRIHDEPSEDNLKDFSSIALAFGFNLPEKPSPADIQRMFDEALKTSYGQYLATSYIRRMRLAIYSPNNIGHYGLALTHYCHFTSPIRRYVDLVAHRLLFETPKTPAELEEITQRCSEQERISSKAESSVVLLKKLRLLQEYFKKDKNRQYEAVVTRIRPFGLYFEVIELMLEGFIHISEIGNDYYVYDDYAKSLYGERSNELFAAGSKLTVMLKDIDLIALECNWHMVGAEKKAPKKPSKPKLKPKQNTGFKRKKA